MEKKKLLRISELSQISRSRELTDAEKIERDELRKEYLANVRRNLKATLDNIEFVDKNN